MGQNPKTKGIISLPTPIKVNELDQILDGYNTEKRRFLVDGFSQGFTLGYSGPREYSFANNSEATIKNSDLVDRKLQKEIELGRIAGPFQHAPFSNFRISPLAIIPKRVPGEYRLIHNLSAPLGNSINSHIPHELASVKYQKMQHAVDIIKKLGKGTLMGKIDIKDAFRLIPVKPVDYELLGIQWKNAFYYDMTLPMGCRTSCATFEAFSSALHWVLTNKRGASHVVHIIDDFLLLGKPNDLECGQSLNALIKLCSDVGVPIQDEKTVLPATCLEFMGISIDTEIMELRLPSDKLEKIELKIVQMLNCKKATLRDIQSLIGLLNFACCVVQPGRAFLRRMIDLTLGLKFPHHRRWITKEAKEDMHAWLSFIQNFNGKSMILEDRWLDSNQLHLYTDASGLGYGLILGEEWAMGQWPSSWKKKGITLKEFFPIVLAIKIWAEKLGNKCITFHSDNEAVVHIINAQTSKEPEIMGLVRELVVVVMRHNILFRAAHIPGIFNNAADLLSRMQVEKFLQHLDTANPLPTRIPPQWLPS